VGAAASTFCGGIDAPLAEQISPIDCVDVLDRLNSVGDAVSPCGFKLALDPVPEVGQCSPACESDLALMQACGEQFDIFAGAIQYETYTITRPACNGGSPWTCSTEGQTRRLQCGSMECSFALGEYGADPLASGDACGRNPPKRDCVGGWRFPMDSVPTEWSDCDPVTLTQNRTCLIEAAWGGDNKHCEKDNQGHHKVVTQPCTLATTTHEIDALKQELAEYKELVNIRLDSLMGGAELQAGSMHIPTAASSASSAAPLEPQAQSALPLAIAAGAACGLVVIVGVALVSRGRKQSYKTLQDDIESSDVHEETLELAGVRASA